MSTFSDPSDLPFNRWDADDALDTLHRAGLDLDHVEQARWPANAPQPRTHHQAFTFRSPGALDPHLLLVFDTPEALDVWRLWLARYWRARPYLSIHDNVLLLVSRELPETVAATFHEALARLGAAQVSPPPATANAGLPASTPPASGEAPAPPPAGQATPDRLPVEQHTSSDAR